MKKICFFAFKGDFMCFTHVLLNVIDMHEKSYDVKVVMEGEAVKLVGKLEKSGNPLYVKAKELGIFDCICKACSVKMGVLEENEKSGIFISDELSGHPAMETYILKGYNIITM